MAKEFECEKDGFVKTALACCVRSLSVPALVPT